MIEFYDNATKDLPAAETLRDKALPGMSRILDSAGKPFAETFEPNARRSSCRSPPCRPSSRRRSIAAEDKRFETHHGIDERGVIRAFIANLASRGRPAGGSTITQQVVKNLSVGDDVTYERKIREIIVASRLEKLLPKPQILGLYSTGSISAGAPTGSRWRPRAISGSRSVSSACRKRRCSPGCRRDRTSTAPTNTPSAPGSAAPTCWRG